MRLRHPAITRTFGVGIDEGTRHHYIVQEYVEGITLAQILEHCAAQEAHLQIGLLLDLVIPVLKALHYAYHDALREDGHALRVVHRDIKPANVLLAYDGRVLLLDLAAARSTSFTRKDTVQDVMVGTAHYLAPEQVVDPEAIGHATDIFAVGVILFELATLTPLLPRTRRITQVAQALAAFSFEKVADRVDSTLYPGVREVLERALAASPAERFATAGDMARVLEGLKLSAGESPGLQAFAADLRRQWRGDGGEGLSSNAGDEPGSGSKGSGATLDLTTVVHDERPSPVGTAERGTKGGGVEGGEGADSSSAPPHGEMSPRTGSSPTFQGLAALGLAVLAGIVLGFILWYILEMGG